MGKVLVIDLNICNGCYNCQVACKDEHVANDWSPIAKPQPDTGQFWNKVTDLERGQVPKVKVTYLHSICQHCDDAPCIPACNVEAIYRRDDGAVIIDPDRCRGNQLCLEACPYEDVIYFNDSLNIAQKCTFCAHLLDDGWTEPRCVDACPTGAFRFGDEDDPEIKELIAKAEPLKPELDVKPRVFYIGLPKPFIAGAVFDSEVDECTEGAKVTARRSATAGCYEAVTDSYGDFWLRDVEPGEYTVLVEKDGYLPQKMGPVDATQGHQRRRHRGLEGLTRRSGEEGPGSSGSRALLVSTAAPRAAEGPTSGGRAGPGRTVAAHRGERHGVERADHRLLGGAEGGVDGAGAVAAAGAAAQDAGLAAARPLDGLDDRRAG